MNLILSLIIAAGVSAWVFSKSSRRLGASNGQSIWTLVGVAFVAVFLFVLILLKYLINL